LVVGSGRDQPDRCVTEFTRIGNDFVTFDPSADQGIGPTVTPHGLPPIAL